MARHVSTHAAGVVITPGPTVEFVPLGRNGEDITTQYPAPQLEELGLLTPWSKSSAAGREGTGRW
jgi:DNA polymerase-3 subunit alpha